MINRIVLFLLACFAALVTMVPVSNAGDFSGSAKTIDEVVNLCRGTSGLAPTDIVAERTLSNGEVVQYRVVDIPKMVEDFVELATTELGWTESQARSDPFGNIQLAETLCGGTKDCGSKSCRGSGSCVYRSSGMSGCRCEDNKTKEGDPDVV